jgi:hypothetical protein
VTTLPSSVDDGFRKLMMGRIKRIETSTYVAPPDETAQVLDLFPPVEHLREELELAPDVPQAAPDVIAPTRAKRKPFPAAEAAELLRAGAAKNGRELAELYGFTPAYVYRRLARHEAEKENLPMQTTTNSHRPEASGRMIGRMLASEAYDAITSGTVKSQGALAKKLGVNFRSVSAEHRLPFVSEVTGTTFGPKVAAPAQPVAESPDTALTLKGRKPYRSRRINHAAARAMRDGGMKVSEIASRFGVSTGAIYSITKASPAESLDTTFTPKVGITLDPVPVADQQVILREPEQVARPTDDLAAMLLAIGQRVAEAEARARDAESRVAAAELRATRAEASLARIRSSLADA